MSEGNKIIKIYEREQETARTKESEIESAQ